VNGNPLYHAAILAVFTVLALAALWAVLTGRLPRPRRPCTAQGRRWRACAVLIAYALALANAVPRMLDASPDTVLAGTVAGGVLIPVAGLVLWRGECAEPRRRAVS
jgi:hypothetical protein